MREYRLDELYLLQMGKTPSRDDNSYWEDGKNAWVSIADLTKSRKYISKTKEKLTDKAVEESGIKIVPQDTVIMSFKLSIGKTAITSQPIYTNEAIMAFIDRKVEKIIPQYAYYLFSAQEWEEGTNRAVMGATLNKATLSRYKIRIHEYETQGKIVEELDKITEVIAKRKEQLEEIDNLVKSQFIEMFDGKYETQPLESVCEELFAGGDVKKDKSSNTKSEEFPYPIYTNGEKNNGLYGYTSLVRVKKEAVTISGRGTIGFTCLRTEPFYPAVRLIVAIPNQEIISGCFLKYFIQSKNYGGQGASIPQLTVPMIKNEQIPIPPIELQNEFARFVEQTDKSKDTFEMGVAA